METETRRALISVTDKSGLPGFAKGLHDLGFELVSSGGTAKAIRAAGLSVMSVGEYTGSPEILGGRVKTLHPRVHGGILARANHEGDEADLAANNIPAIDVVAVNLYQFEKAVTDFEAKQDRGDSSLENTAVQEVLEQIDIGGPTLVRAAAKNALRVLIVVDPSDYEEVLTHLRNDSVDSALRARLAAKAFRRIAEYDRAIDAFFARYLDGGGPALPTDAAQLLQGDLPPSLAGTFASEAENVLRYGENPHQRAFYLRGREPGEASVLHARRLNGKQLSYNNLLDAEAALELVKEFEPPAAVVIKHANPCGAAVAETPMEAFERAYAGDPLSAFGGILAMNRPIDLALAQKIAVKEHFFEVLVAPEIHDDALEQLRTGAAWGKNLRVLACGDTRAIGAQRPGYQARALVGGVLVQERDLKRAKETKVATHRAPSPEQERDLHFAWRIVAHVHSNAIVFVKDGALVGVGAGQMSRVDSVELAARKAGDRAQGAVMASDAFFPFRDGVEAAIAVGIQAVIQPGGSRRDAEVIEACNEKEVAMLFTGMRHFFALIKT